MDIDDWYKWSKKEQKYRKKYLDNLGKLYGMPFNDNPEPVEKTLDADNQMT